MPLAALRPCGQPGCPALLAYPRTYCDRHEAQRRTASEAARPNATDRGYGSRWRRLRLAYLRQHPLCVACSEQGRTTAATDVDHIQPHRGDRRLLYDTRNLQSLCKSCHSRKTAARDGGFGRARSVKR